MRTITVSQLLFQLMIGYVKKNDLVLVIAQVLQSLKKIIGSGPRYHVTEDNYQRTLVSHD